MSYGSGTSDGPDAILRASQELEALLDDRRPAPGRLGIHTTVPVNCRQGAEPALAGIAQAVQDALRVGAVPALIGGEHTVTLGAARALRQTLNKPVGFLQFDAHADLRQAYQGNPLSHASVMRRVHELDFPIFQLAVRSRAAEEIAFRQQAGIHAVDAERLADPHTPVFTLPPDFPHALYVTFDLDAFDPATMPATGTPEPGGLGWYPALEWLARLSEGRQIIGFDVVELAPIPNLHHPDFTAAKLVYCLMGLSEPPAPGASTHAKAKYDLSDAG